MGGCRNTFIRSRRKVILLNYLNRSRWGGERANGSSLISEIDMAMPLVEERGNTIKSLEGSV